MLMSVILKKTAINKTYYSVLKKHFCTEDSNSTDAIQVKKINKLAHLITK